jgi:hypothetical protein
MLAHDSSICSMSQLHHIWHENGNGWRGLKLLNDHICANDVNDLDSYWRAVSVHNATTTSPRSDRVLSTIVSRITSTNNWNRFPISPRNIWSFCSYSLHTAQIWVSHSLLIQSVCIRIWPSQNNLSLFWRSSRAIILIEVSRASTSHSQTLIRRVLSSARAAFCSSSAFQSLDFAERNFARCSSIMLSWTAHPLSEIRGRLGQTLAWTNCGSFDCSWLRLLSVHGFQSPFETGEEVVRDHGQSFDS